ncbi:MAG: RbsD/FucU family protein [Planctomycetota bacterium]
MIKQGILNPAVSSLLCRVRHTNTLVIADRGFPNWPSVETVDLSLVDDLPTVATVLAAVLPNFQISHAWMAEEFLAGNPPAARIAVEKLLGGAALGFEPHNRFKERVPRAVGLIRTGDTTQYANIILESA